MKWCERYYNCVSFGNTLTQALKFSSGAITVWIAGSIFTIKYALNNVWTVFSEHKFRRKQQTDTGSIDRRCILWHYSMHFLLEICCQLALNYLCCDSAWANQLNFNACSYIFIPKKNIWHFQIFNFFNIGALSVSAQSITWNIIQTSECRNCFYQLDTNLWITTDGELYLFTECSL